MIQPFIKRLIILKQIQTNKVLQNEYEKGLKELEKFDDISNLCESSEEESEVDDFKQSE